MTYITAPSSIDNSGAKDVSFQLSDWLTTTSAKTGRTQLRLRPRAGGGPGVYRVDSGVWSGQDGVDLDLNGCWVICPEGTGKGTRPIHADLNQMWPRRRATLNVAGDTRVWSSKTGARLAGGGRKAGGTARWRVGIAYEATSEGQHGIRVRGDGCVIDTANIEVAWTYGDGVYVEWWVNGCEIRGRTNLATAKEDRGGSIATSRDGTAYWKPNLVPTPGIHHTGRQGIAQSGGRNLWVHDLTLWSVGRSAFDFEPGANGTMDGVQVENVVTGSLENVWVASAGKGYVNNVVFKDNVNVHKPLRFVVRDTNNPPNRRKNWSVIGNRAERKAFAGSPLDCMRFRAVDGIHIEGNYQPINRRQAGRGAGFEDCTNVNVVDPDKQFPLVG